MNKKALHGAQALRAIVIVAGISLAMIANSCKKDHQATEQQTAPAGTMLQTSNGKIENIPFESLQQSLNGSDLGALAPLLNKKKPSGTIELKDASAPPLVLITDSVKKITTEKYTSYIIPVQLRSPHNRYFQNVAIVQGQSGNQAFLITYKPDPNWPKQYSKQKNIPFKGTMKVKRLNLSNAPGLFRNKSTSVKDENQELPCVTFSIPNGVIEHRCPCTGHTFAEYYACVCYQKPYLTYAFGSVIVCNDEEPVPTDTGGGSGGGGGGGSGLPVTTVYPPNYNPCVEPDVLAQSEEEELPLPPCDQLTPENPPPANPYAYTLTAQDLAILQDMADEDYTADHGLQNTCYGTARTGNVRFAGTVEHWLIQFDYQTLYPGSLREYSIPGAAVSGRRGYADIVNEATGEMFEIKPNTLTGQAAGAAEVAAYIAQANVTCPPASGAWVPGLNYVTRYLPNPRDPLKLLESTLNAPGVIVYREVGASTIPPLPVTLPDNIRDKIKDFFRNVLAQPANLERLAISFLRMNPEVIPYLKAAAVGIMVATIVEDFITLGGGISDDWLSFVAARNLWRLAAKM